MLPNDKDLDKSIQKKKNLREANSYQIQHEIKKNRKTNNKLYPKKNKQNNNFIYSRSNCSAKTFNQKPKSNLIKDSKEQSLNNFSKFDKNDISYSNISNPEVYQNCINYGILNNKKNDVCSLKDIQNLKKEINELSNSNNKNYNKIFNTCINNSNLDAKNNLLKESKIKTMINQKKIFIEENLNNENILVTDINKKNINGSINANTKIQNKKCPNIFKKLNKQNKSNNKEKNISYLYKDKFFKININENEKNDDNEIVYELNENQIFNRFSNINNFNNNNQDNNDNVQIYGKNTIKKELTDKVLYHEIDEKLDTLCSKIQKNKKDSKNTESIDNTDTNKSTSNILNITYPNLKRYRQKSESNIRIALNDITINDSIITNDNISKIQYLIYDKNNTNLPKFKILEEKIKNENSTKRMINNLLNEQKNPEFKEILSNLKNTMNKFPKYEERKDNNYLSTLPANYLSEFDTFSLDNNKYTSKKINLKYNSKCSIYNTNFMNNKKFEKFKSTFDNFKSIINGKNNKKNLLNIGRNDNNYSFNNKIIYSSLCPVNDLVNNFNILESKL